MEVVMGLQPEMPQTLLARLPVRDTTVNEYVEQLVKYLRDTRIDVAERARELAQQREATAPAGRGGTLAVGDVVLRRKDKDPKGSERFNDRTDGRLYRIRSVCGRNTYTLAHMDGTPVLGNRRDEIRVPADLIVKLDLPEFDLNISEASPRRLEIMDERDHTLWRKATLERFTADGQAVVRFDDSTRREVSLDLTAERYRWLYSEAPPAVVSTEERRELLGRDVPAVGAFGALRAEAEG